MGIDFNTILPQKTPDTLFETDWLGGVSALPTTTKKTLIVGYATAATYDGEIHHIPSVQWAKDKWGEGSHMAVMAQRFYEIAPRSPLYGMSYTESADASASSQTVTLANAATANGVLEVWCGGRYFAVSIVNLDAVDAVGANLVLEVAKQSNLPFTAANSSGVVTFTAVNKGTEGHTIRIRSTITSGIAMTSTDGGAVFSGATLEGSPAAALAAIQGDQRFHLFALNNDDAVNLALLSTHIDTQSTPSAKKWAMGGIASVDTNANAITIAESEDSYRTQLAWLEESETPVFEITASFMADRSLKDPRKGLDGFPLKNVKPAYDRTKWPTPAAIEAALEDGVTPLRPLEDGTVEIVRSVVTRATAPSFIDHNPQEISDYTDDYLTAIFTARMQGKTMKSASPPGNPETVTPGRVTALLNQGLMKLDENDYLQGVQTSIDNGNNFAEVNAIEPTSRIDAAFDFFPVGLAHVLAFKKTYITESR